MHFITRYRCVTFLFPRKMYLHIDNKIANLPCFTQGYTCVTFLFARKMYIFTLIPKSLIWPVLPRDICVSLFRSQKKCIFLSIYICITEFIFLSSFFWSWKPSSKARRFAPSFHSETHFRGILILFLKSADLALKSRNSVQL